MSSIFVLPLSNVPDICSVLYLNPELEAYSNLRRVEDVIGSFDAYADLPNVIPSLPSGFNSSVYIAASPNVSIINRAIRDAMLCQAPRDALDRQGAFVGTILQDASVCLDSPSFPYELQFIDYAGDFSSNVLQSGDQLKLILKHNGIVFYTTVDGVSYGDRRLTLSSSSTSNNAVLLSSLTNPNSVFNVFGIKIFDPHRQARVTYVRSEEVTNPDDVVPTKQFVYDMYQLIYPDTRGYSYHDAYIDYRSKWRRSYEYRVKEGGDIYNINAPYTLNNNGGGGIYGGYVTVTPTSFNAGGGNLWVYHSNVVMCSNLVVTPTSAMLHSPLNLSSELFVSSSGGGGVGWLVHANPFTSGGTVVMGYGNFVINSSNSVSILTDLNIGGTLGVGMSNPSPTDYSLAVAGDIFSAGTVVTLSDIRAKRDIRRIDAPIEKLSLMHGYTFAMLCDEGQRRHTGLIAQEVMQAMPEAVHGGGSSVSVAYGNLVGLLVESVNELVRRVESLECGRLSPGLKNAMESTGVAFP